MVTEDCYENEKERERERKGERDFEFVPKISDFPSL